MTEQRVKIGPVVCVIEECDWPPDKGDGSQPMGRSMEAAGKILLLRSMPDDVKLVTLWHEIIHMLLGQSGHEHDEGVIEAVSHGIVQVLQDNAWLRGATGENAD